MPSSKKIIRNIHIVNRGKIITGDVLIAGEKIQKVDKQIEEKGAYTEINGEGKYLLPGIIDDQVHFREPGLTHKANIATESRAALMGGVTTFMEMPNTSPPATNHSLLESKYRIASKTAYTNYSFFMGTTNDNYDDVMRTDYKSVCGIKIFMGSSTGNMLVDNTQTLEKIFAGVDMLIATHCEDEQTIKNNLDRVKIRFGQDIKADQHPLIRNEEACVVSTTRAIQLAKKYGSRLHVLHISTEEELELFDHITPLEQKKITAEACVHFLHFTSEDYQRLGNLIKCNPAIKQPRHKEALWKGLLDNKLDIIATDHAPHTFEEKSNPYISAPAGLPLVQHSLNLMLHYHQQGKITLERIVEKMCHNPAICFRIADRGYIDEGCFADLVMLDMEKEWTVEKSNIGYKCGWSPLEQMTFKGKVMKTLVNGIIAYEDGMEPVQGAGLRLRFLRK